MMIKEDKRQATYELWFLGDVHDCGIKNRETFTAFLVTAGSLMQQGIDIGVQVGGVEITEVNRLGFRNSVWSMSIDEFKVISA